MKIELLMTPAEGWQFHCCKEKLSISKQIYTTSCLNTNVRAVQANKSGHSKGEVYTLSLVWHTNKRWTTFTSAY